MTKVWMVALAATCIFTSCMQDDDAGKPANGTLQLNVTGLTDLGPNHRYQAWIVVDGAPVQAGTFTVDAAGKPSRSGFPVDRKQLTSATEVMVTVEPSPDTDAAPAITVVAGNFTADNAEMSTTHPDALGVNLSGLTANYILSTPTTPDQTDELAGLWFAKISNGAGLVPGLPTLPPLPANWRYEAWAMINNQPVSMGKFQAADRADEDNRFGGTAAGYSFPGEDFVANAPTGFTFPQNLSGTQVMISVEPLNDTHESLPFMLQPFAGQVATNAMSATNYELPNQADLKLPKGSATR